MLRPNPKTEGSGIVDAVPCPGPCPLDCPECFYNRRFYMDLKQPILRPLEETDGKIVRVNSGGDSNIHRNYVIESTACYKDRFFNTSIPVFDFPGPVVFTCNARTVDTQFYAATDVENLMAVRVLVNTWNERVVAPAVEWYTRLGTPVLFTFMRYYNPKVVRDPFSYEARKHVLNKYWDIRSDSWTGIMESFRAYGNMVRSCGSPDKPFCKDCGICETLYRRFQAMKGI